MSDLFQETREPEVSLGQVYEAQVARAPLNFSASIDIVIPDIHPGIVFHNVNWQARDNLSLPQAGDDLLVIFDNNNKPWVISWMPATRNPVITTGPVSNGPPSNPIDGDIWIAYGSATGMAWQFVYEADWTTDAYKWKCIGGGNAYAQVITAELRPASSAPGDLATVGPSIPIPRAGIYHVNWGSLVNTANSQSGGYAGSYIYDTTNTRQSNGMAAEAATNGGNASAAASEQIEINPPITIKLSYFAQTNQNVTFSYRWLSVYPLRIK